MEKNRAYYMRRAAQERSAADHASGEAAKTAHLELARRYRDLVSSPESTAQGEPTTATQVRD